MDETKRQLNIRRAGNTQRTLSTAGVWVMLAVDVIFVTYMAISGLNWLLGGIFIAVTAAEIALALALLPGRLDLDYRDGAWLYALVFALPTAGYGLLALVCDLPTLWIYFAVRVGLWLFSMLFVRALCLARPFIIALTALLCVIPAAQIFVGGDFDGGFAFPSSRTVRYTLSNFENGMGDVYTVRGVYPGLLTRVEIPETYRGLPVVAIEDKAFQNSKNLKTVVIPDSVIVIGEKAFAGCSRLKSVTVPASVTMLGTGAFKDCRRLTRVELLGEEVKDFTASTFEGSPAELVVHRTLVNVYRQDPQLDSIRKAINPAVGEDEVFVHTEAENNVYYDTVIFKKGDLLPDWHTVGREAHTFAGWYVGEDYSQKAAFPLSIEESVTLYARWLFTYKVYYVYSDNPAKTGDKLNYVNSSTGERETMTNRFEYDEVRSFTEESETFAPMTDVRNGDYTLGGWRGKFGLTAGTLVDEIPYGTRTDVILYARWTGLLRFDYGGAPVSGPSSREAEYRQALGTLPQPERRGYDFRGWYTRPAGQGSLIDDKHVYRDGAQLDLYAAWDIITYVVRLSASPGASPGDFTYTVEDTVTLPVPNDARLAFAGWYQSSAYTGNPVTGWSDGIGNRFYYAKWTEEVSLDYGYDSMTGSYTAVYGKVMTGLPTPERVGYAFLGWFDSHSNLVDDSVVYRDQNALTGRWLLETYSIAYEVGGGTVSGGKTSYTYEDPAYTLPQAGRTGYTFAGWFASAGFAGEPVTELAANSYGDKVFYAKWTANSYTVTFDYNGGTGGIADKTVTFDSPYGDLPAPTRPGYRFAGWYDGSTRVVESTIYKRAGDTSLLAHWTPETYVVTFDYNGGSGSVRRVEVTFGEPYGQLPDAEREGYAFDGWFDGDSKTEPGDRYVKTSGSTLTARWTPKTYTLTFDTGAGSGQVASKKVVYDAPYGVLSDAAAPAGYTFDGWFTAREGGERVTSDALYRTVGDSTLYARYTPITYRIRLVAEGQATAVLPYTVEDTITLTTPTREGYTFAGWFTAELGGERVSAIGPGEIGDRTLYGRWIPLPVD